MSRAKHLFPALLLPLLAACGAAEAPPPAKPLRVSVTQVGQEAAAPQIEAAGTAALRKEIPLGFTTPGQIAGITVQEGDRVRRGQVLATLDMTSVGASLEAAAAERDRAGAELTRLKQLYAQGWITKARLEAAEAAARSASANVSARRFSLQTARVVAPADGIVLSRMAEPGQIIDAGMPVVTLGDASSGFVLRVLLADRDAVRVRPGIPAEVRFDALPGIVLSGPVIEVGGRSDRGTGAFTAEIALPPDPRLRSGLVGRATIATPAAGGSAGLIIPPTAIFSVRADEGFVYVVDAQKRVKARRVALGPLTAGGTEVLSGLNRGEVIALSGLDRLRDGTQIDPVSAGR
ncbi:efflux RND transporter periplasmic adaptor subunit [Novosphingobium ginsenosidimutans]|uniref:Efflux RND transporter periplasmic adaptor subunit n=1 Tax=Novosphingobium ginsenosidimutans TaxID=1176536 RepID=A0A5B8S838_9SPHN|nr:efflux RND transporter periplasmic adaptor subunit [Novosphingobium ginsenosidimutans]QEA16625.1 efflux RND transporter periplasmic adaptor subunit [Novosphingobium ginsenosidimutans]